MNKFSELYLSLELYKKDVDKLLKEYSESDASDKRTYSDAVYAEKHSTRVSRTKSRLDELRSEKVSRLNSILGEVQDSLKAWLTTPVNDRMLNTIVGLHNCGVKLTNTELEALQESLGSSYFGMKLIESIAKDSGIHLRQSGTDAERYTKMLSDIRATAGLFLNSYAGEKAEGIELMDEGKDNFIYASCNPAILRPTSSLLQASVLWDGSGIPQPKKDSLSAEEKDIISRMFENVSGMAAKKAKAAEIIANNPDMKEPLSLHPDYKYFLPEESEESTESTAV